MDLNRWVERVYNESDPGRGIGTSAAGTTGLTAYLYWEDWVVAGFVTIIVFPIGRILASAIHSHWKQSRERNRSMDQLKDVFDKFGSEERAVIQAFIRHGGSVITWEECYQSPHFSDAGIESLRNRGLMRASMTADGMTPTFVLDTQLFDDAQKASPNQPCRA